MQTAISEKIIVLGVDGMDPSLTKKFMDQGKLPNIEKLVRLGAQREDLVLLGAHPTITPPMWTTLATGAYAGTHGITCFWNQEPNVLETLTYAFDSAKCKAELLWNVFSEEAGKKTLVWHWPGSSWPPTTDSTNLSVVDGTQPQTVNGGVGVVDVERMVLAAGDIEDVIFKARVPMESGAGCVLNTADEDNGDIDLAELALRSKKIQNIMLTHGDGEGALEMGNIGIVNSPIHQASKWANAPADAKEFTILFGKGEVRRPVLLLKNDEGAYDTIAIYKNKSETTPLGVIKGCGHFVFNVLDDMLSGNHLKQVGRAITMLTCEPDGSRVRLYISNAMDIQQDEVFHPKTLYQDIISNIGHVPPTATGGGTSNELVEKVLLPLWENYTQWQADCLNYLIKKSDYEIVFSHLHNIDCLGHAFYMWGKDKARSKTDERDYQRYIEAGYRDTDKYLGSFLHLLDEGWTIFVVSDHGLLIGTEEEPALFGDAFGINAVLMDKLGHTKLQRDTNGALIKEIDWSQTTAVASRGNHIYINLKGRNATGIVEEADKYNLESRIIDDLYRYRNDQGKRIIALAIRNRDAALIGMDGPDCGDIIYFLNEGFNRVHGDSLSTFHGYFDSSVSPIFIAAGKGIKKNFTTTRRIRQVDVAPTIAYLGGVRMPAQCEGAPIYQILSN